MSRWMTLFRFGLLIASLFASARVATGQAPGLTVRMYFEQNVGSIKHEEVGILPYFEISADGSCNPKCAFQVERTGDWGGIVGGKVWFIAGSKEPPPLALDLVKKMVVCTLPKGSDPFRFQLPPPGGQSPAQSLDLRTRGPAFGYQGSYEGPYRLLAVAGGVAQVSDPFMIKRESTLPTSFRNRRDCNTTPG